MGQAKTLKCEYAMVMEFFWHRNDVGALPPLELT
jgi:hypothetical protein